MASPFLPQRSSNRNAFTLLELIISIAIIIILAGISFPLLGKIQNHAKGTTCVSNLRQHLAALQLYANENNGYLPYMTQDGPPPGLITFQYWWTTTGGTGWLMPTPVIKQTPSGSSIAVNAQTVWRGWYCAFNAEELASKEYRVGYSINSKVVLNTRRKLSTILNPGTVPLLFCYFDEGEKLLMGNYYSNPIDSPGSNPGYRFYNGTSKAHKGSGSNFGFLDGHVEFVSTKASREEYQKLYNWNVVN